VAAAHARRSLTGALERQLETAADEGSPLKSATECSTEMHSRWSSAGVWWVAASHALRSPAPEGWASVMKGWVSGIPGRGRERGAVSKQPK